MTKLLVKMAKILLYLLPYGMFNETIDISLKN